MTPKREEKVEKLQKTFNVAELEHYRVPDFISFYANNAGFGINFFDLSIVFGQIVSPTNESMLIEDRLAVTMSIEHAKALMMALQDMLATYEKTHGQIRKPSPIEIKS
jgi:hypothetical protein